jgi:hypothetical protein
MVCLGLGHCNGLSQAISRRRDARLGSRPSTHVLFYSLYALDDANVALGSSGQNGQRFLISRTVMRFRMVLTTGL